MFSFERTYDWKVIRETMTHPSIYPHLCDDFAPDPSRFEPLQDSSIWYIAVRDKGGFHDGRFLGIWVLVPESKILADVHTCLLPQAWGITHDAAKEFAEWIWTHTPFVRLTTKVPSYNALAVRLAKLGGMEVWGKNPVSWRRNGILYPIIHLGMSKPTHLREPA